MKLQKNVGNRGFTLVELMIVIVIIGVLAALASFGFIEYVKKSKSAEADEFVKKIGDGAKIYYTSEQRYGGDEEGWHAKGTDSKAAGMPVPGAEKVFPGGAVNLIWTKTDVPAGGGKIVPDLSTNKVIWKLLNYTSTDPTYFHYGYHSENAGATAKSCIVAEADFDNDGTTTTDACAPIDTNQTLSKVLTIKDGEVNAAPAVLQGQGL